MPKTATVTESDTYEIFKFAEEHYGVDWNLANDIFFAGALDYGAIQEVFEGQEDYVWGQGDEEHHLYQKASDVPREVFDSLSNRSKGHIMLWRFMEHHNVTGKFMVDCD